MVTKRVYIAFDYDNLDVKEGLVAQSKDPDCPFKLIDNSIREPVSAAWTAEAKRLIASCDYVIVLCGEQTHQAKGVAIELQIAQELDKRYFLIQGTRKGTPTRPKHARADDKIWSSRWPTVLALLEGRTPPPDAGR